MDNTILPDDMGIIRRLLSDEEILRVSNVSGGFSSARKYMIETDLHVWMCKCFQTKPRISEWYELANSCNCRNIVSARKWFEDENGEICTLVPWIDGMSLEEYLLRYPGKIQECGAAAGMLLRKLHEISLDGVEGISDPKMCLLHNDLKMEHFIVCDGQLYMVDFENGGVGYPEADIRRFEKRVPKSLSGFFTAFLSGYYDAPSGITNVDISPQ